VVKKFLFAAVTVATSPVFAGSVFHDP